jgi:hypothetical protein
MSQNKFKINYSNFKNIYNKVFNKLLIINMIDLKKIILYKSILINCLIKKKIRNLLKISNYFD